MYPQRIAVICRLQRCHSNQYQERIMKKRHTLLLLIPLCSFTLMGCVPSSQTGTDYSRQEARKAQQIKIGQVIEVSVVNIEGTKSGAGGVAGGAVGGLAAGSAIGGGTGSDIAAIAGVVIGAAAGAMAEEKLTEKQGHEYTIRLEPSGKFMSVVQAHDPDKPDNIVPGDYVKLLVQGSTYRVVKLENYQSFK
jgi:outer membrane lipoprotein SlyB